MSSSTMKRRYQKVPMIGLKNQRGQIRRLQKASETSLVLEQHLWTGGPRMDL